jgi:hypothetical protein
LLNTLGQLLFQLFVLLAQFLILSFNRVQLFNL